MNGNGNSKAAGLAWITAERAAGRPPDNAAVRRQFDVSERTARNWLGHTDNGSAKLPAAVPPATTVPANGNRSTPTAATTTGKPAPDRQRRRRPAGPATGNPDRQRLLNRLAVSVTGIGIAAVLAAPVAISARSLAGWGRDSLGLANGWEWVVPLPLDGTALACVGLALHATLRGDAPGLSRVLIWAAAGGSSWANWRHGSTISPDAALFFGAMPLVGALLLELVVRRVRHTGLDELGAIEPPLARYRVARWLVAPRETWRAWRTAVREGITDPAEALAIARLSQRHSDPANGDAGDSAVTRPSAEAS